MIHDFSVGVEPFNLLGCTLSQLRHVVNRTSGLLQNVVRQS